MLLSINAWSLPRDLSVEQQCAAAAAAGFAGIELTVGTEGHATFETPLSEWRRFGAVARHHDLSVTGLASGIFFQTHYSSRESENRRVSIGRTLRMLDIAVALQTDAIIVIPAAVGRATDAQMQVGYVEAQRAVHTALSDLRHEAESRAVTIALENAWNRFLLSPLEMAELIDRVNSPHVACCLDLGNVMPFGYPQDWIRTLGRRIARVHMKDYDLSRPGRDGFCGIGEGSVDWAAVAAALRDTGYSGPLTSEGAGEPAEMRRQIALRFATPVNPNTERPMANGQ